ncbi:MAG: sensor histidine kinase [Alphaproteobacteria bacterium]|nr:sensor histidine kinase [Alphaproteobacteria bacterium]
MLLLIVATLISVVPLGLFWLWPHSLAIEMELDDVRDRHLVLADKVGVALQRYHRDAAATFAMMAANVAAGQEPIGAASLLGNLHFRHISLVEPATGRVLRTVAVADGMPGPAVAEPLLSEIERLAVDDTVRFSGVVAGSDGRPMLAIVRRIGGAIAFGALDTDYLASIGRSISFGRHGHAVIVDAGGRVLAHPIASWVQERRDISALSIVKRLLAGQRGITTFHSPAYQADMVAAFVPVAGTGWGVMVPQPISELHDRATATARPVLVVFAIGLCIAILVAGAVSVAVSRPIRAVIHAARRRAAGDESARIPDVSRSILRDGTELVQSFNAMADTVDRARAETQAALVRAEEASASKTRFLANVSHELRTPLNAVLGFAELMLRGDGGAQKRVEYLHYIHQSATHLLALIKDLLDLSKIEAGAVRLDPSNFPLRGLLAEALALMRTQADLADVRLALVDETAGLHLNADERGLRQVLLNLLANAIRYTHAGDTVELRGAVGASGDVEIVVRDNGPGIPPGDLKRVLEPFQRGTETAARGFEGTGLGLPISKRLVELHGGTLVLESVLGKGTTAIVTLPAARIVPPQSSIASAA